MSRRERLQAFLRASAVYFGIVVVTLVLLDVVLIATGLFPPRVSPGHPTIGWESVDPTGAMEVFPCYDPSGGDPVPIQRNEQGHRSSWSENDLRGPDDRLEIAVTGDSHTDLCLPNEVMHFGVLESDLIDGGLDAAVFAHGAGRYSPLQEYLAVQEPIAEFEPDVLVMNLYTGNDFYDILRVDDRPYFVATDDGYDIAPPVWYQYDPPGLEKRSRVLATLGAVVDRTGIPGLLIRLRYLSAIARDQGSGFGSVVGYMNDLRHARTPEVGYQAAFAAQILNQQLFFHRFPKSADESMRRVVALMEMIRAEHPDMLLIMSPIPSYQLVQEDPVDGAFTRLLDELPVTYEYGVELEAGLFEELREAAAATGWMFVDNLEPLQAWEGPGRLYNDFDYHINVTANEIVGRNEAEAIRRRLAGEADGR